jgi:hypothetical protein
MTDYTVTRRSLEQIEQIAKDILAHCPKQPTGAIDILAALRQPRIRTVTGEKILRLKLVANDLLPNRVAQMWGSSERVTITARISLWNRAEEFYVEAQKDLRHEYSHGILHSEERTKGNVPLNRLIGGNKAHEFIEPERRAEDQADWLAACLGMPRETISSSVDVRDLIADLNVTLEEAQWRLEKVRLAAPRRISETLRSSIETIRAAGSIPGDVQALWDNLPLAPDYLPRDGRLAGGFLIEYCQYRMYNQTGWNSENGRIVPLMLKMGV